MYRVLLNTYLYSHKQEVIYWYREPSKFKDLLLECCQVLRLLFCFIFTNDTGSTIWMFLLCMPPDADWPNWLVRCLLNTPPALWGNQTRAIWCWAIWQDPGLTRTRWVRDNCLMLVLVIFRSMCLKWLHHQNLPCTPCQPMPLTTAH